jgi:hypothetical protein
LRAAHFVQGTEHRLCLRGNEAGLSSEWSSEPHLLCHSFTSAWELSFDSRNGMRAAARAIAFFYVCFCAGQ